MKPRKKILIVGADPDRVSILKFILDTSGYTASVATSTADALDQLHSESFSLLLCEMPLPGIQDFLDQAGTIESLMRTVVTGARQVDSAAGLWADAVFYRLPSSTDLLERVALLCARKRGSIHPHKPSLSGPITPKAKAERAA
jgi:DNA-binding NtrC family response regulator